MQTNRNKILYVPAQDVPVLLYVPELVDITKANTTE